MIDSDWSFRIFMQTNFRHPKLKFEIQFSWLEYEIDLTQLMVKLNLYYLENICNSAEIDKK